MELQINDVKISLESCDHCKATPDEADAMRAITLYQTLMGETICAHCGKSIKPTSYTLHHMVIEGPGPEWYATPDPDHEALYVRPQAGVVAAAGFIHRDCAKALLPFLPPEVLVSKNGAIWPSPDRPKA